MAKWAAKMMGGYSHHIGQTCLHTSTSDCLIHWREVYHQTKLSGTDCISMLSPHFITDISKWSVYQNKCGLVLWHSLLWGSSKQYKWTWSTGIYFQFCHYIGRVWFGAAKLSKFSSHMPTFLRLATSFCRNQIDLSDNVFQVATSKYDIL